VYKMRPYAQSMLEKLEEQRKVHFGLYLSYLGAAEGSAERNMAKVNLSESLSIKKTMRQIRDQDFQQYWEGRNK
jgi:hypothetical protein